MARLSGLTVMVTRPKKAASRLARALARRGARVLFAPAIRIQPPKSWAPLDKALAGLEGFDAAAFASANAVEAFFDRARRLRLRPQRPARVFAVGPATARALAARGWKGASFPEVHEGGALARHLGRVAGRRILIPRAEVAREELVLALRKAGARVTAVPAYGTVEDREGLRRARRILRDGGADWVIFASASAVGPILKAAGGRPLPRAASIGPVTSAALRRRGVEPAAEAGRYTAEGLADALCARSAAPDLPKLEATLRRALLEAGAILRRRFLKVKIRYKGPANIVTAADHASERRILGIILRRHPDHDFLTEERAPRSSGSDFLWVIDPLDGTTNYAHGYPACCVSIGLLHRGRPLLGGVFDPFRGELFLARRGGGATLNGRRLSVSRVDGITRSLLVTGFAYDRAEKARYYLNFYRAFMERCHDVRRSGSAALDLAWTAAGRVEGYWEFNLSPWDVAAGMLLVREAGGKVTDFAGKDWTDPKTFGRQTLASNGRVHAQMLRMLRRNL